MENIIFKGTIEALAIGDMTDFKENRVVNEVKISNYGIEGDRHSGTITNSKSWRQSYLPHGIPIINLSSITMTSKPELEEIAQNMGINQIEYGWLSENIIVSELIGVGDFKGNTRALSEIPTGARFVFEKEDHNETVVLFNLQLNPPCGIPGRNIERHIPKETILVKKFKEAALGKRGLILFPEKSGTLKIGDEFKIYLPKEVIDGWEKYLA